MPTHRSLPHGWLDGPSRDDHGQPISRHDAAQQARRRLHASHTASPTPSTRRQTTADLRTFASGAGAGYLLALLINSL